MKNNLIFGGINSAEYGIWISGSDTFSAPERSIEYVSVPGRNGDLIIDNGKWKNVTLTYPAFIMTDFADRMGAFRAAMARKKGYQRLEDSYHPDEYRLASFSHGIDPSNMGPFNRNGEFNLTFNCKPQRFLKSGEIPMQFLSPYVVVGEWRSHYIPVNDTSITIECHCPAGDEFTVNVITYDTSGTDISTQSIPGANGVSRTLTLDPADKYLRIKVEGIDHADETWLRVMTTSIYNGEAISINAVMARTWEIQNPTGFPTKPLIEIYGRRIPQINITNYINGELVESCMFHTNDTTVRHILMDCDVQYVYDDDKNNLTPALFMTTTSSLPGQGIVFPEFGEDQIKLSLDDYATYFAEDEDLGVVNIYPNWWKI